MFKYCLVRNKSKSSGFTPNNFSFTPTNNPSTIFCPLDSNSLIFSFDIVCSILVRNGLSVVLKTPNRLNLTSLLITGGLMF